MRIAVSFLLMSGLVVTPADAQSRRTTKSSARSAPAKSAPSENAAQAWPIASLTVRGNQLYDSATILKVAGLKIGQKVGKDQFDAARDRLLATGAFTSVGYEFKPAGNAGFAATFDVAEIQQAYPWRFDSVKADEAKLRAKVIAAEPLFTKVMPGTDVVIKRVTAVVEEGLKEQGQPEPILGRVSDESGGDLQVVFRPSTLPSVAEVKFTGNQLFPTAQLQTTIASTAVGSVWTEKRFREILDLTIRPLYETRGRVRVAFPKLSVEPAKDVKGLVVTVDIDEGGEYELSDVVVEGTANSSRLVKESGLKTGATFDGKAVQEGIRRVVLAVQDRGYINATATSDRTIDDKEKKVKLAIKVS
ncbi:MAG TPA: POTRA domain-containing protein, partial [Bryobacteraceae bacterium]|nr:POTRA domain-containing protein [Bryobacteraceae bacterium]